MGSYEERERLLDSLELKYEVVERVEGKKYIILYCKKFIDDIGGIIDERRSKRRKGRKTRS